MKQTMLVISMLITPLFLLGFSLENTIVPKAEILSGGPPKDGIPALLEPKLITAQSAAFMRPDDPIIGVVVGGEARAYPIKILNWHEVVNDAVGDSPFVVTF